MKLGAIRVRFYSHYPLPASSKIAIGALLGIALLWGTLSIILRNTPLLISTAVLMLFASLILTGIRWMPLLGSLLGSFFLYVFLFQDSFTLYHLTHPKDTVSNPMLSFALFVFTMLVLWCAVLIVGAGIGATIQNYLPGERQAPRWLVPAISGLIGVLLGTVLIAAVIQPSTTTTTEVSNGEATVHLGISNFSQSSVTIAKGAKLKIIDDGTFKHDLFNGTWSNGEPVYNRQAGAPNVNNVVLKNSGQSVEIGPFTSAGTYHIYCSIHSGMTLTIIVQ